MQAVEAMIHVGMAGSRAEAVDIGRQMVKAKVFHHCLGDHDFGMSPWLRYLVVFTKY